MAKLLIVISGPAGVGKRCVMEGIDLYCTLGLLKCRFSKTVLYNTRKIRQKETDGYDYHYCYGDFLSSGSQAIQNNKRLVASYFTEENLQQEDGTLFQSGRLFMSPVRNRDLQGINLDDIEDGVNFLEIFDPFVSALRGTLESEGVSVLRLFISPFTSNELKARCIEKGVDGDSVIRGEMISRIRRRRMFGLSNEDDAELEKRTKGAVGEISTAFSKSDHYHAILVNPCDEAHPSWGTKNTLPTGEAKTLIDTLADIIRVNLT